MRVASLGGRDPSAGVAAVSADDAPVDSARSTTSSADLAERRLRVPQGLPQVERGVER